MEYLDPNATPASERDSSSWRNWPILFVAVFAPPIVNLIFMVMIPKERPWIANLPVLALVIDAGIAYALVRVVGRGLLAWLCVAVVVVTGLVSWLVCLAALMAP